MKIERNENHPLHTHLETNSFHQAVLRPQILHLTPQGGFSIVYVQTTQNMTVNLDFLDINVIL